MPYKPKPIDTSGVSLPRELNQLVESLAQNNHDLWAKKRIAEGWKYGPRRDDAKKTHPDLVPYSDLAESEKEYDRVTAMEALKAIVAFGYQIEWPSRRTPPASPISFDAVASASERLKGPAPLPLRDLLSIWRSMSSLQWKGASEIYELLGNRMLKLGEPLLAYDVIAKGLEYWPVSLRLRQLLGLALARSGATERANQILRQLYREGHKDGETLGLLARTHKSLWEQAIYPTERQRQLTQAHSIYHQGWCLAAKRRNLDDAIYTGINAAATALFMGKAQLARTIARKVRAICQTRLRKRRDYWAEATLGEAAVISGSFAEAEEWYSRAAQLGRGQYSDLSATRHQARLLMDHLGEDRYHFDHCFSIPKVIVFAGHMIDQPGRPQPRFPAALEQKVRQEIAVRLRRHGEKIGYSGAACGSDILFLEEMLEQKGEANITLPFPPKEFQAASVDIIPRATWGQRFHRVLKQATRVIVASEHRVSGSLVAYEYANLIQEGLARLHARMLDTDVIPLVVWDHRPGDGPQGTASIVEHWRSHGLKPEVVDIASLLTESIVIRPSSRAGRPTSAKTPYLADTAPGFPQEILAMLFADVVGYSKLTEEQIPRFARYFMGEVARLIAASPRTPVMKNTWGDALYLVFTRVGDAGTFALDLCDKVCGTDWAQKGLPKGLSLRIGLHAGPAFTCDDPVLEHRNCIGSHVNWAARIEPITPPGQVYASEPFAALAAAEGVRDFACDNVGRTPLAKGFRASPTYHLRRRRP